MCHTIIFTSFNTLFCPSLLFYLLQHYSTPIFSKVPAWMTEAVGMKGGLLYTVSLVMGKTVRIQQCYSLTAVPLLMGANHGSGNGGRGSGMVGSVVWAYQCFFECQIALNCLLVIYKMISRLKSLQNKMWSTILRNNKFTFVKHGKIYWLLNRITYVYFFSVCIHISFSTVYRSDFASTAHK